MAAYASFYQSSTARVAIGNECRIGPVKQATRPYV